MSTYIYLQCLNHDPVIRADRESGQHLYDLPHLRELIANREEEVETYNQYINQDISILYGYYHSNTVDFLFNHQKCNLGIVDEYGKNYPLIEDTKSE